MRSAIIARVLSSLSLCLLPLPQPAHALTVTEGAHENRPQFIVQTESATYYYDRAGGGFSRMIDPDGADWIAFSKDPLQSFPASAAAGYRGMPNAVFGGSNPDAGAGHPGFDQCKSSLAASNKIRTVSLSGRWAWTWTFTERTATMTMEKADPDHAWWFLYEGPIAGSFRPRTQFWGTDEGGPSTEAPDIKSQRFDQWRWVYLGDRRSPHILFLVQHEPDPLDDTLWYLGSSQGGAVDAPDGMMVFGFGRGRGTRPLFRGAGQSFTAGFVPHPEAIAATPGLHHQSVRGTPPADAPPFAFTDNFHDRVSRSIQGVLRTSNLPVPAPPVPWPEDVREVTIPSSADGSWQRALFRAAPGSEPRPLLVALHSWSGDYTQADGTNYLTRCRDRGWHFIHPDFRGVNRRPEATCSDLVVADILDAVAYATNQARVDPGRIYLAGASGGGMAALQMLAKAPRMWAGVSAWVPISDLAAWHHETRVRGLRYTPWIEASCGGAPGLSPAVDFQYWNRSPLHFLKNGAGVPLDLNAGIQDGHTGSVPVSHSLRAFNVLAADADRIPEAWVERITLDAKVPDEMQFQGEDPVYGAKRVLFRRESRAARITLFDGGHEILHDAAFEWLEGRGKR